MLYLSNESDMYCATTGAVRHSSANSGEAVSHDSESGATWRICSVVIVNGVKGGASLEGGWEGRGMSRGGGMWIGGAILGGGGAVVSGVSSSGSQVKSSSKASSIGSLKGFSPAGLARGSERTPWRSRRKRKITRVIMAMLPWRWICMSQG